jgi:hypothetical protein
VIGGSGKRIVTEGWPEATVILVVNVVVTVAPHRVVSVVMGLAAMSGATVWPARGQKSRGPQAVTQYSGCAAGRRGKFHFCARVWILGREREFVAEQLHRWLFVVLSLWKLRLNDVTDKYVTTRRPRRRDRCVVEVGSFVFCLGVGSCSKITRNEVEAKESRKRANFIQKTVNAVTKGNWMDCASEYRYRSRREGSTVNMNECQIRYHSHGFFMLQQ